VNWNYVFVLWGTFFTTAAVVTVVIAGWSSEYGQSVKPWLIVSAVFTIIAMLIWTLVVGGAL